MAASPRDPAEPPNFGTVHVTLDGVILNCDEVYATFIGVSREEAVGCKVTRFTADAGSGGPETMISILVRTGEPLSIRRAFVRPDGSKLHCTFSLCLIRDAEGRPHSVVGIGQLAQPA